MAPVPRCAVCERAVDRYTVVKNTDGQLEIIAACHGETDRLTFDLSTTAVFSLDDSEPVAFKGEAARKETRRFRA